jgi:three-Cys-motif partner protein
MDVPGTNFLQGEPSVRRRSVDTSAPTLFELPHQPAAQGVPVKRLNVCLWTAHKAQLIQCYLDFFVYITKHGTYIDGFAGPQAPDQIDSWSAKRVLESQVRPKHLRNFFLFDADPDQIQKLEQMRTDLAPLPPRLRRRIEITQGDFNEAVVEFLRNGKIPVEPTFCLLDQRTFECRWSTVEALASYKPEGTKIEIFYFLPIAWLDRAFSATSRDETLINIASWWGRDDWRNLQHMKSRELAKLFSDRFKDLGYADVKPWPIYNDAGSSRVMYYMIHATDHREAPVLMRRAYERVGLATPSAHLQLELRLEPADLEPPNPPTPNLPEDLFGPPEANSSQG